jgi:hypothetical protein
LRQRCAAKPEQGPDELQVAMLTSAASLMFMIEWYIPQQFFLIAVPLSAFLYVRAECLRRNTVSIWPNE